MAKHGLFGGPSWLLPVLGGAAALATGGLGLGGLLGGGAADAAGAGAGAAEAAGAGAADLGAGIGTGVGAGLAGDTGLASSLLAAPAIGATGVSSAAAPLAADALAGVGDISGIGAGVGADLGAAAAGLGDVATGATPSLFGALSDAGPALTGAEGATAPLGAVTTTALPAVGSAAPGLAASADPTVSAAIGDILSPTSSLTDADLVGATTPDTGLSGILGKIAGPLKTASAIGSLGLLVPQLFKGPTTYPEQNQLQSMAGNEVGIANQFLQPLQSGVLPPGAASAVDAAKAANTAAVVNADANLGIGGSTMEAQQLQAVNNAAAGQTFQIADQLAQNALPYSNLATQTTQDLLKTSMTEDADYQAALANFAKALAGLGGTSPTSQATAV